MLIEFHSGRHPNITRAYNLIGNYHRNVSNDMEKALYYHMASYESARGIYGEVHSTTAAELHSLGALHHDMAQYEKAIEYYEKAHDIFLAIYGEGHYHDADYYNTHTAFVQVRQKKKPISEETGFDIG
jgi:tetratricopeptide (TPR) repeat protein